MDAEPRDKSFKMFDGNGLYIEIYPAGGKLWRWRYRFAGKDNRLSLGGYPKVSLEEVRGKCVALHAILSDGINPREQIKMEKVARCLEESRQLAPTCFSLGNDGALSFRLGNRRLILTPAETFELRTFLDATRAVKPKEASWP